MGHKRTISSLIMNHFNNRNADLDDLEASYDADLVRGKGKGLIILLHGAPGVGKTSTAETIADAFGRILLPITCGDLGLTAADVESELSEKFHLAELWDCVLLLDEADVFLARRTNTDIKRNSLVSVFLRVLEYFTGVLFLTTNRVGAFDEAFKSRIHISLYYPPLDKDMTRSIWKMNLERLEKKNQRRDEPMHLDDKEILEFAQRHYAETFPRGANWNGRQIRNAFQTASALAEYEAYQQNKKSKARSVETGGVFLPAQPQLRVKHFREITLASYEFDKYISETRGYTETEFAYMEGQRTDAFRTSRSLENQPTQIREAPARNPAPLNRPRPKVQGQATPASRTFESEVRQMNARPPVDLTYNATEARSSQYDQPPARQEAKSVNTYGPRGIAPMPGAGRSSIAFSRPKSVQQPNTFTAYGRDRQRKGAFNQPESQYLYEDDKELEYEPPYDGSLSQPVRTNDHFEDTAQDEISLRRHQARDFPSTNQTPATFDYEENFEDDEDLFDR